MKKEKIIVLIGLIALGAVYAGTKPKERFSATLSATEIVPGSSWTGPKELLREDWNKKIVLTAIEAGDKGNWEEWEKKVAERFMLYGPRNRKPVGRKICRENLEKQNKALRDGERTIHAVIAKEDKVIVRMELTVMVKKRAYHAGEADEMRALEFTEISIYRLDGGQIVEQWVECDATGFANDYMGRRYGGWTRWRY